MEKFGQWFNEFCNTKVGIIIAATISVLLILVYIFSKTSIGRKALFELRSKALTTKAHAETTRENVENELKKQKENYEEQLQLYKEGFEFFRNEIFEVLQFVPNKKVKDFVKNHKDIDLMKLIMEQHAKDAELSEKE